MSAARDYGFQFLGIPPKGELASISATLRRSWGRLFPISRDPPEGGTAEVLKELGFTGAVSNF